MARKPSTRSVRAKKPPKWVLHELWLERHGEEYRAKLWRNLKQRLPELEALRVQVEARWPHHPVFALDSRSFGEYYQVQPLIRQMAETLQQLLPERPVRKYFSRIIGQGTGREFVASDPVRRSKDATAISEAVGRAYYFVVIACEAGRAMEPPVGPLTESWSALLFLFELSTP